ncbi:MAG: insulinase family protein [Kofleriaceae bacterium]
MGRLIAIVAVAAACGGGKARPTPIEPPLAGSDTPPADTRPKAVETPVLVPAPLAGDPTKTTIHRLSNGMTVYLCPDPQEPSVVAHIAVRAGGRHDPKQSTGLAHYLEHMLFKGTPQLGTLDYAKEKPYLDKIAKLYAELRTPGVDRDRVLHDIDAETQNAAAYAIPNEMDQLYARMGLTNLNANTSSDATIYSVEVPRNRLAQWARVEAQRFANPVWRLFWPELEAVYEEKNISLDSPEDRVDDAMVKALFPSHGYGWGGSVLGEVEHLKSPAYQDMEAFFARYYTPGNMAILLAGDVDASVLPLLEKELGALKRPPGDAVEPGELTALAQRTELAVPVPSDEGVTLAWPAVAATHPDALALELMDAIVLDGESGMLARELLLTQKVASARASVTAFREAGYYELAADALDGQTHAELENLLLALVDKLQRGDFTEADLATAILTTDVQRQRQLETNQGRMEALEAAFITGESWTNAVTRIERLRALTKADVVRVAKQYLTKNYVLVKKVKQTVSPPKITKPGITPVKLEPSRQTAFAKSILAMPTQPIEPRALVETKDYERAQLPTGELIGVRNQRNGLFALTFEYDVGRADDRLTCLATSMLEVSGAGKRSAEEVARRLHELGLAFDVDCTKTRTTITLSGVDKNLEAGMAIARDALGAPVFDAATLKARIATVLTERANSIETPQTIQTAQAAFARYGADSDFLVVATNRQLQATTPAMLQKLLGRYLHLSHRTSYFGPRPMNAVLAAVTLGDGSIVTKPRRPIKHRKPGVAFATHQDTAQTQIVVAWPLAPTVDAARAAGAVFSEYAALLLYQEVREARGLAYSVSGYYETSPRSVDDAAVSAYAGVQADKVHDALDAMLAALRMPIDDKRLETARETIAQNYRSERIAPRAVAATVYAWQDQGEKSDPRAARVQRTLAVDAPALAQWLKTTLAQSAIVAVIGNKRAISDAKLKAIAPVTWVPIPKLFGY